MSKRLNVIIFFLITILSILSAAGMYGWLYSVQANTTLKTTIPTIFFIASFIGLWLLFNFFKLFIFQRRGARGYNLRARITSYFLLSTLGFVIIFGALMFYLIFLIENTFIDKERSVADNLLDNYKNMINMNKNDFENYLTSNLKLNSQNFPIIFTINNDLISFKLNTDEEIKKSVMLSQSNIIKYFNDTKNKFFYLGEVPYIVIMKNGNLFYANNMKKELIDAFLNLKNNADTLYQLRLLKRYILPVSILSIFILTVPILVGVFFMSFFVARNITVPIEEIVKGTKLIADGNLDYKVHVHTHDEIGDFSYNFNSMATKLKTAYRQIKSMERMEAWQEMARRLAHENKEPTDSYKIICGTSSICL